MDEATSLHKQMEENGYPSNSGTYNLMIRGFVCNHDLSRAVQLANEMGGRGFSADVSTVDMFLDLISSGKLDPSLRSMFQKDL